MQSNHVFIVLITIIVSFLPIFVHAQTNISGNLSGSLGPGDYIVVGDCNVQAGESLTLAAGTTFLFSGHYAINIYGQLIAEGTDSDSIKFIRQSPIEAHRWGGIRFYPTASSQSALDYCVIDYCKNTGAVKGGGLYLEGVGFPVKNSRISNCYTEDEGAGIYAEGNSSLMIDHCVIVNNRADNFSNGGGVQLRNSVNASILNSIIAYNIATGD
jgi:hypothetical protein